MSMYCVTSTRIIRKARCCFKCARLGSTPVTRLSIPSTSQPSASNRSHKCEPRNPAAPVNTTRIESLKNRARLYLPERQLTTIEARDTMRCSRNSLNSCASFDVNGHSTTIAVLVCSTPIGCRCRQRHLVRTPRRSLARRPGYARARRRYCRLERPDAGTSRGRGTALPGEFGPSRLAHASCSPRSGTCPDEYSFCQRGFLQRTRLDAFRRAC